MNINSCKIFLLFEINPNIEVMSVEDPPRAYTSNETVTTRNASSPPLKRAEQFMLCERSKRVCTLILKLYMRVSGGTNLKCQSKYKFALAEPLPLIPELLPFAAELQSMRMKI